MIFTQPPPEDSPVLYWVAIALALVGELIAVFWAVRRPLWCRLRGHHDVQHITAIRMLDVNVVPGSAPGLRAFSLRHQPTDWYYACSRCGRRRGRNSIPNLSLVDRIRLR